MLGAEEMGSGIGAGADQGQNRRMIVAIAGGALQGLELTYLARRAGFETILLDRRIDALAAGLCDRFVAVDLTAPEALRRALGSAGPGSARLAAAHSRPAHFRAADLVLPATENPQALRALARWCQENEMPMAFDPGAYAVSSSKSASDALFRRLGIPAPTPWPDCAFPVVAKPDGGSGSKGVEVFPDRHALEARFGVLPPPGHVLHAYLAGPSYSIEVLGRPGSYSALQVTSLEMDDGYDCKRILAPSSLPSRLAESFGQLAVKLAEDIELTGIMDVEAILHEGQLKVLEIDARFPSQTPMAVYHSTGVNMVELLAGIFLPRENDPVRGAPGHEFDPIHRGPARGSILEHIRVGRGQLTVCGERIMAGAGPLHLETDFFGADEVLTDYHPQKEEWVATLVVTGSDLADAWDRRESVIGEIRNRCRVTHYRDESPRDPRDGSSLP